MSGNTNKNDPQNEIDAARARARAYKEKHAGEGEDESSHPLQSAAAPKGPRSEAQWSDAVSQAIEEAMRKGEFDNLPGRGKPLPRNANPFTPPGSELAFDILKNNDLAPGWIGARNDVQRAIEEWRGQLRVDAARIAAAWAAVGSTPDAQQAVRARAESQRTQRRALMDALNRRIRDVNLQQPVSSMHLFMLRLPEEERRAGIPEALLEQ
jgi:hypothetical protein